MKLIGSSDCPLVRKVRISLAEKKIEYEFVEDVIGQHNSLVLNYSPLGKAPVLVLDDDSVLYDSRVIVEYLDNGTPNNKLFPQSGRERINVKRWEALGDGICDLVDEIAQEQQRNGDGADGAWFEQQRNKLVAALALIARDLGEQAWCCGNAFSFADISVGIAIAYLDYRLPGLDWRELHPNLGRLCEKLAQRPSFIDT